MLNLYFNCCLLFIIITTITTTNAKNYGNFGNAFPIIEKSFLELVDDKLKNFDVKTFQENLINNSKKYMDRPTPTILPYANEDKTYYFDPSITLEKDYKYEDKFIARKGTKINPLDVMSLSFNLIFIDGDNDEHLKFATKIYNKTKLNKPKIIFTNGRPFEFMKDTKIKVYFDQRGALVKKFNIEKIPAVVSQSGKLLKIEEVKINER
ncbi:MAG: type-F conjugative transfer system protein TraW [Rickettsiales bacterium]|nr:type-F conjugative transfer system protein TraW [Rickettsiales bacterium]